MPLYPSPRLFPSPSLFPISANAGAMTTPSKVPIWYLGPLGNMRPLPCPETDLQVSQVRYGGIHQGISGSRVMDITGFRNEYTLDFKLLDQSEYQWLEAIYSQLVPGPHYLVNPLKRNLLSNQSSTMAFGSLGVTTGGSNSIVVDYPAELGMPSRSIKMMDWTGPTNLMVFDSGRPVPIIDNQPLIYSVYLKADAAINVTLRAYWYNDTGSLITNTDTTVSIDSTWARYWMSYLEPPTGAVGLLASINFGTAGADVYVCAPQVETGVDSPTAFDLGGGCASVIIDQLPETSPRFPLRDVSVSFLET